MREKHPEWIARNGYKWADGYFVSQYLPRTDRSAPISVKEGHRGAVDQNEIQDAMKDDFREAAGVRRCRGPVNLTASIIPKPGWNTENRPVWPDWKGALPTSPESGVLARGHSLPSGAREREQVAEVAEGRRGGSTRVRENLLEAGRTTRAVCPRATVRAEYEGSGARIAQTQSSAFLER